MTEIFRTLSLYEKSPYIQLILALTVMFVLGGLAFMVFLATGSIIFHPSPELLVNPDYIPVTEDIWFIQYTMCAQDISFFIIPGAVLIKALNEPLGAFISHMQKPGLKEVILIFLLTVCLIPVTDVTGVFNSSMSLPEWLSRLEEWMMDKEDMAEDIIDTALSDNSFTAVAINIVTIAILPAIGEELIFRGVLQKVLCRIFKSGHAAIFITAFIFSFVHLQFYGFLPRFILGAVFGYLFFWSGKLWAPVLAHFLNNAMAVGADYIMEQPVDETAAIGHTDLILFAASVALTLFILRAFREKYIAKKASEQ